MDVKITVDGGKERRLFQALKPLHLRWLVGFSVGCLLLIISYVAYSLLTTDTFPTGYPLVDSPAEVQLGDDGFIYYEAARQYQSEQPIYWVDQRWPGVNPPYYMPAFFALFSVFTGIADKGVFAWVWLGLLLAAYLAAIPLWRRILETYRPQRLTPALWSVIFALALLATDFWANLYYGNAVLALVLLAGVSVYGIYHQQPILTSLAIYLTVITKPQWAFLPAVMLLIMLLEPLYRGFVGRTVMLVVGLYLLITALMMLQTSPAYTVQLLEDNIRFILQTNANYPYERGLSYNASWQQMLRLQPIFDPIAPYAPLIPLLWVGHFAWMLYRIKNSAIRFSTRPDLVLLTGLAGYLVAQMQVTALMDLILGSFIVGLLWTYPEPFLWRRGLIIGLILLVVTALTYVLTFVIYIPYALLLAILLYALITRLLHQALSAILSPEPRMAI